MSEASKARRRRRREEWREHTTLARLLERYLDPTTTFWTSLENRPSSFLNGLLAKKRGVRSGLPDVMVIIPQRSVFVEVKSPSGRASRSQKQIREELVGVGCAWWMARSARAALTALHRSGVPFRRPWRPIPLRPWEGPFSGAERRLPQHPEVAARQRAACQRWRAQKRARALEEAAATERADATAAQA